MAMSAQTGASRTWTVSRRYLNLPVENGAPKRLLRLLRLGDAGDGPRLRREFAIELARGTPDFWVVTDVAGDAGVAEAQEALRRAVLHRQIEVAAADRPGA